MNRIIIYIVLISVLLFKQITGLKCYSCTYCGDPFRNSSYPLVNCTAGFNYCLKTVMSSSRSSNSYTSVRGKYLHNK